MKSRLSYFLISVIIILSLLTGGLIWRNKHLKKSHEVNEQSFNAPISSKYIPTNADLVFHWKVNPKQLPNYIENYQDKINRKITNKKIRFIRDSSFRLISLDFAKDISKWAGDFGSFAVFESNKQNLNDWLLVLGIDKDVNIEEELDLILDPDISNEYTSNSNKLNIPNIKIILKKVSPNQLIYFATEKDKVLISSNPKIIKSSIEQLDNNDLNTKEKYKNIQLKDNLVDGVLLLEMSPKKLFSLIGQKEKLLELNKANKLITSINLDNNELILEGLISYDSKTKMPTNDINYNLIDIQKEFKSSDDLIFIDNPKQYFGERDEHPYQRLIASVIEETLASGYSNLLKIIFEHSKGNLIWINDKNWLVLTSKSDPSKKQISTILEKRNFLNSNLEFENKNLEVWSKISKNINEKHEIKDNIEAIIGESEGTYIWSQKLSSISNFDNKKYFQNNLDSEHKKDEVNDFDDIIKIHLGKEKTELILNNFYPYILFRSMLGNQLDFPQNTDLSISVPTINYPDFIKFKINLKTS